MANRTIIIVNTPTATSAVQTDIDQLLSNNEKYGQGRKIVNYFRALLGGDRRANTLVGVCTVGSSDAVAASLVGTFTGAPTANDTITINGVDLTAIANASTPTNNQFRIGTTASTAAANLTAAINASTSDALSGVVKASVLAGAVTISCLIPGVIGNSIVVAESAANFTFAGSATALANGTGKLPILTSVQSYGY